MGLDIRIPLGLIFLVTGAIMAVFGVFTWHSPIYTKSMDINLNLIWGGLMFLFGLVMFVVGRRQRWQDDPTPPRPWERAESQGPKRH